MFKKLILLTIISFGIANNTISFGANSLINLGDIVRHSIKHSINSNIEGIENCSAMAAFGLLFYFITDQDEMDLPFKDQFKHFLLAMSITIGIPVSLRLIGENL